MIKSILVSTDGSESSKAGLEIGASIATIVDARLLGLFVRDGQCAQSEKLEEESLSLQQEFQECCRDLDLRNRFLVREGEPASEIARLGKRVDLIISGISGKHFGVNKNPGETITSLLKQTATPVLLVPEEPSGEQRLVIAYDGSNEADRLLKAAAEFATLADFKDVHLVSVGQDVEQTRLIQKHAVLYLAAYGFDITSELFQGERDEVIPQYVEDMEASVLAIKATGAENILDSLCLGKAEEARTTLFLTS